MHIAQSEAELTQVSAPKAGSQDLVFFLPGLIDLSGIGRLQGEVQVISDKLRTDSAMSDQLRACVRLALDETLAEIVTRIQAEKRGLLGVDISRYRGSSNFRPHLLLHDYGGVDSGEIAVSCDALMIPTQKITGIQALPYPSKPGVDDYHPVVNMRIESSADVPTTYCGGPSQVEDVPSLGRWYLFPLQGVELSLWTVASQGSTDQ